MSLMISRFSHLHALAAAFLAATALCAWGQAPQAADYQLSLGGATFDPLEKAPPLPADWLGASNHDRDFFLVQLQGPTRRPWLRALEKQGWEIIQYIYPFTYVVWGPNGLSAGLAQSPGVRWRGPFEPGYRVAPQWRNLSAAEIDVHVLVYRAVSAVEIDEALLGLGGRDTAYRVIDPRFYAFKTTLPGDRLRDVADLPGVYTAQPAPTDGGARGEVSNQIHAGNHNLANQAAPGYLAWLDGLNLSGQGVVIANVDSGIDQNHPDLAGRIKPCVGPTCGGDRQDYHGTHTAGIMAADGSSGAVDNLGFLRGLGVAPGARLVEQFYPGNFTLPGGMLLLMTDSARNGAGISGNSWGPSGLPRGYDIDTMLVDIGVRDADPDLPGAQPQTYVLSIMNGRGGTSTQGTPDEAKNLIAVGATIMQLASGSPRTNINSLANITAHGPALDGRTLPHLVAPGCYVDSTTLDDGHITDCGTSMASPHVTGSAALFVEYYRRHFAGAEPSPALIKAAFLPVAIDLFGNLDADGGILGHRVDSKQGWGRMDLGAVVDPDAPVLYYDQETLLRNTGESWTEYLAVADPTKPLKLMAAWTDAPGHGLGGPTPAWNNNLDLTVTLNGQTYRGNQFGGAGWSVPALLSDVRNNAEGVLIGPVAQGEFEVRVTAANLASDGVPFAGNDTDQDFALVCYNCETAPSFQMSAVVDSVSICAGEEASYQLALTPILNFQGAAALGVSGLPAGVTASFSDNPVTLPGTSQLTLGDTGSLPAGEYWIRVDASAGGRARTLYLELLVAEPLTAGPIPLAPGPEAVDEPLAPVFVWSPLEGADAYRFELARDVHFTDLRLVETIDEPIFSPIVTLRPGTAYFWRVRGRNACGDGVFSPVYRFETQATPTLLLVDDDDNNPDVRAAYTDILDAMGVPYAVWDAANSADEPSATDLAPFLPVLWFSGAAASQASPRSGPSPAGEQALAAYLQGGGCLALSAQDYATDIVGKGPAQPTALMADWLGVASVVVDAGPSEVTGLGEPFGSVAQSTLSYPFANRGDGLTPDPTAAAIFTSDQGDAAIAKTGASARSAYFGFPLEAMDATAREDVFWALLEFFEYPLERPCRGPGDLQTRTSEWPVERTVLDLLRCLGDY